MISATPFEATSGRMIHLTGLFGTLTFSLEDAEAAVLALQSATERARDATALHTSRSVSEQAIRSTQSIYDLARSKAKGLVETLEELGLK